MTLNPKPYTRKPYTLAQALEERAGESGDEEAPKLKGEELQDRGDWYDARRVTEAEDRDLQR